MTSPCVSCSARASCQPIGREYTTSDGKTFVKEMDIAEAGTIIPQHAHGYEHISYVARGSVLFEGKLIRAGTPQALGNDAEVKRIYLGDNFRLAI